MNKTNIRYALGILIAIVGITSNTLADDLTGTVKTADGKPISDVYVFTGNSREVKTDSEGKFKLTTHGRVLHFYHPEFRRLTKVIDISLTTVEIVLETQSSTDWILSPCSGPDKGKIVLWGDVYFTVPKEAAYRQSKDIDYQLTVFWNRQNPRGNKIQVWIGPNAISPFPKDEWFTEAKKWTQEPGFSGKAGGTISKVKPLMVNIGAGPAFLWELRSTKMQLQMKQVFSIRSLIRCALAGTIFLATNDSNKYVQLSLQANTVGIREPLVHNKFLRPIASDAGNSM